MKTDERTTVDVIEDTRVAEPATEAETPTASHWLATRAASLIVIAVGVLFAVSSSRLDFGTPSEPGSGFWPLIVSVVVIVLGVISALEADETMEALQTSRAEFGWAALAFLQLSLTLAVYWYLGYFAAAFFAVVVMGRTFGRVGWRKLLIVATLFAAVIHGFFAVVLMLPPPNPLF